MIPQAHITAWRTHAPWPSDAQIEQDLVLSRALVELFNTALVSRMLTFRGGTALHKLFLNHPGRYSEDIDLVQMVEGTIGPVLDTIRQALDPWLGVPKRNQSQGRVTLLYRFETTVRPVQRMRLKVEINTREHFTVSGIQRRRLSVVNPWFSGEADISTHAVEELLGTKLRALYQRKKGRDLYDLWLTLTAIEPDDGKIVHCFEKYLEHGGTSVSRAEFEMNLFGKMSDPVFIRDVVPFLPTGAQYDIAEAGEIIHRRLISRLRGDPWKTVDSSEPFRR